MNLPVETINVLASLKMRLLNETKAQESETVAEKDETIQAPRETKAVKHGTMRHARVRHVAWQRSCQRREFFAPTY